MTVRIGSKRLWLITALWLVSTGMASAAPRGTVQYVVSVDRPASKRLNVTITVDPGADRSLRFQIPAWAPGYYQILNFEKNVSNFRAFDSTGRELDVSPPEPSTWHVTTGTGAVTVHYEVKAEDAGFGFFGSHVDPQTGYFNGPSALMYVVDGKELPARMEIRVPSGWKVACSLDPDGENAFRAADYDELIDCPVQMGKFERLDFTVKGLPFAAILVGESNVERSSLVDTFKRVSAAGIDIMGYAPFKRYYYFVHFDTGNFGGGLEHRNSTILNVFGLVSRQPYPWAALAAHEFFHLYNVKRLRPETLGPFDYLKKTRTANLWFAEGVTEYYAQVLLRKSGITTQDDFRKWMSNEIGTLQRNPARLKISAEEASMKGWEGGSMGFGGLNYYLKGSLLGLMFDIKIRAATGNKESLDDVLRLLEKQYGQRNVGYPEDAILKAINEVTAADFTDTYDRYVRGTEEIPWADVLQLAGLRFSQPNERQPYFGISTVRGANGAVLVEEMMEYSPAAVAGLKNGDIIVTLNGAPVRFDEWSAAVNRLRPGRKAVLAVRRGGRSIPIAVTVGSRPVSPMQVLIDPAADAAARRVRDGLLRRTQNSTAMSPNR